jgi:hypothetical protein
LSEVIVRSVNVLWGFGLLGPKIASFVLLMGVPSMLDVGRQVKSDMVGVMGLGFWPSGFIAILGWRALEGVYIDAAGEGVSVGLKGLGFSMGVEKGFVALALVVEMVRSWGLRWVLAEGRSVVLFWAEERADFADTLTRDVYWAGAWVASKVVGRERCMIRVLAWETSTSDWRKLLRVLEFGAEMVW